MSGGAETILPIAGAVVGGVATGGNPAGVMAGYSLGSAAGGFVGGGDSGPSQGALLGAPSAAVRETNADPTSPFYSEPVNPTGNMPQNVQAMNLPKGTEAPGSADKAGYVSQAMQSYSAAQDAQSKRDLYDAKINEMRYRDPTVVHGPKMDNVATSISGGFPTVGGGFIRY